MTSGLRPAWLTTAFLLALVAAPFVLPEFSITLANYIGLYALVALGLVLLTGVGGLTSFGQAAFVGLGAYATAVLSTTAELPSWLAWLGASPWLGLLESFSSFWASAYKEVIVFTLIIPVLLWRSLRAHHIEEEE